MNKALILSVLIGGMCGNIATPIAIQSATAAPLPAKIELLTPGAEPRREVKFRPTANSKQTMTMTVGISMDMSVDDLALPKIPIPKMLIKVNLNVQKVDPSGDIYYDFAYGDIKAIADKETSPETLAVIQKSLKSLTGIRCNIVINSSGLVKSKSLILPKTVDPMTKETLEKFNTSMNRVLTQLPSGMLGVGAKWQVTDLLQSGGIEFNQSSIYEIVEINDIGMTVQTKITQSALPQEMKVPSLGKNVKAKLTGLTTTGEGQYRVKFDSLLPISGKISTNTSSKVSTQTIPKEGSARIVNNIVTDLTIADE